FYQRSHHEWTDFTLIQILSLYPYHPLDPQVSWGLTVEITPLQQSDCPLATHPCQKLALSAQVGSAFEFAYDQALLYLLAQVESEWSARFPQKTRPLVGAQMGLLWHVFGKKQVSSFLMELEYHHPVPF